MKNVIAMCPNPTDATSLYRGVGPLQALRRKMGSFSLQISPDVSWASLKGADVVFMQRPALDHHRKIVDMAVASRRPIWLDFDDDLFSVPPSNNTARVYGKPNVQNNIAAMLAKATVVTVSTGALAEKFRDVLTSIAKAKQTETGLRLDPTKVMVVPNAYDDELNELPALTDYKPLPLVLWRGSSTHDKDLMEFTPALAKVAAMHPTWSWNFVGEPFWWTMEALDRVPGAKVMHTESLDPIEYFAFLRLVRPAIVVVPLEDTPFNRSKSNIAWQEATHAGAVTIAPDWPEWQHPGVLRYRDPAHFAKTLDQALRGELGLPKLWQASRDVVAKGHLLSQVNRAREVILRGLFDS